MPANLESTSAPGTPQKPVGSVTKSAMPAGCSVPRIRTPHTLGSLSVKTTTTATIRMNKASEGDGIPVKLLQILKDDAVKVLHSVCQQLGKLSSGHRTGKGQFSFQSQRKAMLKNVQTTAQLHSSHMLAK